MFEESNVVKYGKCVLIYICPEHHDHKTSNGIKELEHKKPTLHCYMLTGIPEVQAAPSDITDYTEDAAKVNAGAVSCLQ